MRERRTMRMLEPLLTAQRARRAAAQQDLAAARQREQAELAEQAAASGRRDSALADWSDMLAGTAFAPELSSALGRRLLDREAELEQAGLRVRGAAELQKKRLQEWQRLEAQVRAGEKMVRRLGRKCARRDEEGRLAEQADRITWLQVRP